MAVKTHPSAVAPTDPNILAIGTTNTPSQEHGMSAQVLASPHVSGLLSSSANPELRRLSVRETDDEIRITGSVSSFYLKQMAQESIRCAVEGRRLVNKVEVRNLRPEMV